MRWLLGGAALLVLGTLTACSDSGSGGDDGPGGSGVVTPSANCRLLNAKDRAKLAGVATDKEAPVGMKTAGQQCRWIAPTSRAIIETTTAESGEWATKVPGVIDQLKDSGVLSKQDLRELDQAQKALAGAATLGPDEACDLFTTMAEIGGAPDGSDSTINYVPLGEDRMVITAQTCTDGRFTSIALAKPKIVQSVETDEAMMSALETAHTRALAAAAQD